ncbi:MAG TPA: DUF6141 family protein [Methanoregulaceae archaeon]|nr:DUF6141 family protein [Methanoregulaceae archaeon]
MTGESPGDSVVYSEEQRFRQIWILLLVGFIAILAWYSFLLQIVIGEPFGTNPAPDILVLILLVIFGIIFPVWFLVMRLEVQVTRTDLRFRMFPLHIQWREVPLATIVKAEAVTYRPILEYGGWGIRIGKKGWAYNVSGNRGVQVTLEDGKSFLLGSLQPERLASAIQSGMA